MKIIGITGTSGTGKTTLSNILSKRNDIKIIDADKVAKKLSQIGSDYLLAIRYTLGNDVFLEDGNLNRKALAEKIYTSEEALEKLNILTFDHVVKEILCEIENTKNEDIKFIVIDAPLLFESELDKKCDYTISLIAKKELKIKRICQRDNISEELAQKRLNIQQEDEFYIKNSDYIIVNNEDCDLNLEIEKIFEKMD